ncbi:hypothetical protein K402DRAFT_324447, partial [Aulographum hederae CBS 113979]
IGGAADAIRMQKVVSFYEKLPRGKAPAPKASGPLSWYQNKYFGEKPSGMPIIHVIAAFMVLNYGQAYYYHLRHHKNNAH